MKKKITIIIATIFASVLLVVIATNIFVKNNYDIRIITDSGTSFFIFSTSYKEYYVINSSLGIKSKTKKFDIKMHKISSNQLSWLREIEQLDERFTIDEYDQTSYYVFFYENYIFYSRNKGEGGPHISNEDWQDMQENIYKYDINTKQIEKIKVQNINETMSVNVKLEALMYLFPNLKEAISKKCVIEKDYYDVKTISNYSFDDIYYEKDRIFFLTYQSSSKKGTTQYLYEYIPATNKTNKIAKTRASIIHIDIIK